MRKRAWISGVSPRSLRYPRARAPVRACKLSSKNFAASSITSWSVRRRCSFFSMSGETTGIGTPAMPASFSTASGKVSPSVSITKPNWSPCFPEEKQ